MRLKDKVAVVTGAAGGIGFACAQAFVKEGAKVVLSDVDTARGQKEAKALGDAAHFIACDVGDSGQVKALIDGAVQRFGRIDICVNNAGIIHGAEFLDLSEADFDRVLRVNLKGVFLVGQAAARQMVKQGAPKGRGGYAIVNMSSVNGVLAIPNQAPYVTSKGGVNQLTKVMAMALAPRGIRVNAIGPGTIATELAKSSVLGNEEARRKVMSRTPLGRLGEVEEIASVAVFLASDDSSYVTGQTIYPDGGRLALNYTVPVS
jgi:NAD(P)-dependent dehydrogenase (short-subunit alcohol dehydrogenase family)